MNMDKLNSWLSLAANVGVVAGIVFLAIEIRQNQTSLDRNSELMEREYQLQVADGLKAIADASDDFRIMTANSEELTRIWLDGLEGKELSETEYHRFRMMCGMGIWNSAALYRRSIILEQEGFARAEERYWRNTINSQPGMRECWENNVNGLLSWGFEDFVDAVTETAPN
jgi:hypothetical protein